MGQGQQWLPRQMGARVGREQWIDVFIRTSFWSNPPISIFFFTPQKTDANVRHCLSVLKQEVFLCFSDSSKRCINITSLTFFTDSLYITIKSSKLFFALSGILPGWWNQPSPADNSVSWFYSRLKCKTKFQFLTRWTCDARITLNRWALKHTTQGDIHHKFLCWN